MGLINSIKRIFEISKRLASLTGRPFTLDGHMVGSTCNNKLKEVIIGSSDSDLQPAIIELKNHGVQRIYLGFENMPNKGLTFTTNRTILIRNSEVLEFLPKTLF